MVAAPGKVGPGSSCCGSVIQRPVIESVAQRIRVSCGATAVTSALVVSDATEHLVAGRFDRDTLGPPELEGMTQPVSACRVRGL